MNIQKHEINGLMWGRITNNIWSAKVAPRDYLFVEIYPRLDGSFALVYRNIELDHYSREELRELRQTYQVGYKGLDTLAFLAGHHFGHYEWIEYCNSKEELEQAVLNQTSFNIAYAGDYQNEGVPNLENNIYKKSFIVKKEN